MATIQRRLEELERIHLPTDPREMTDAALDSEIARLVRVIEEDRQSPPDPDEAELDREISERLHRIVAL